MDNFAKCPKLTNFEVFSMGNYYKWTLRGIAFSPLFLIGLRCTPHRSKAIAHWLTGRGTLQKLCQAAFEPISPTNSPPFGRAPIEIVVLKTRTKLDTKGHNLVTESRTMNNHEG